MRTLCSNLIICIATLFLSCAGGNPRDIKPEHLTTGMKHIKKGNELYHKGCYKDSLESYFRAHEQFAASDQLNGVAMSLNNIGNVYRIIGDRTSALLYFDAAYKIYAHLQDNEGMMDVLSNKAATLLDDDKLASAEALLKSADGLASSYHLQSSSLNRNKAILYIKKKEYHQAEDILNQLFKNLDQDSLTESAAIHVTMGNLLVETQHYREAIVFFEKALTTDRQSGFHKGIADVLAAIGSAYHNLEEYQLSSNYYQRSLKIYALIANQPKVNEIMERLNEIAPKAEWDMTLTRYFVERWLAGEAEGPCE